MQKNSKGWLICQYAEHLVAPVPAVLKPEVSLLFKAIAQFIQDFLLTILKVELLVPLEDQKLLCPIRVQP